MRFFFHCHLGDQEYPDWSGMDLDGRDDALLEGARIARELGHEEEYAGAVILVIDADGVEIGRFTAVHPPADPS